MEYIRTIRKKRFPKIDGDSICSDVHKCNNVFADGLYKVELPSKKFKYFRYKSFHSMILGPVYQVIEEVKDVVTTGG